MSYEGGFQGRTNKLVDGCYSFWQSGAIPLIHMVLTEEGKPEAGDLIHMVLTEEGSDCGCVTGFNIVPLNADNSKPF